jgi:hypothetical protein
MESPRHAGEKRLKGLIPTVQPCRKHTLLALVLGLVRMIQK